VSQNLCYAPLRNILIYMKPLNLCRSLVLRLAWLGFACRLVVPAGYMPAAPGEGGFIKLCPAGAAGLLVNAAPAAHAHAGHGNPSSTHDHAGDHNYDTDYCPVGAFFSSAATVPGFELALLPAVSVHAAWLQPVSAATPRFASHQPRAPPVHLA